MSGTITSSMQNDNEDSDNYSNTTANIYPTILAALVTALTGAITTAVYNTNTTRPVSVNAKTHSSVINPYDSRSMNMITKDGKFQWYIITKPKPVWSLIVVTVENAEKLMDLFKDHKAQFGLNSIMQIPTMGTVAVETATQTIINIDQWNANLSYYKNLLT